MDSKIAFREGREGGGSRGVGEGKEGGRGKIVKAKSIAFNP